MQIRFQHSGYTISKYFNVVLDALLYICPDYVKIPGLETPTPSQISTNPVFYPFFKGLHFIMHYIKLERGYPVKYCMSSDRLKLASSCLGCLKLN
ncbi:hypothetical protein AAC387_Pa01g1550 [Persea americana]